MCLLREPNVHPEAVTGAQLRRGKETESVPQAGRFHSADLDPLPRGLGNGMP